MLDESNTVYGMSLEKDGFILQAIKEFLDPRKKKAAESYNELMGDNRGKGKEDSRRVFTKLFYWHDWKFKQKKAKRIEKIYDLFLWEYIRNDK